MKPCDQNRKLIVWLTLNALDARQTRQVQAHLETCEGCRRYLAEISNVTERLAAAEATPEVQASESFHRNVAGRLRSAKPDSLAEILTAGLARLNWHLAMPVMVTVAMVSVMFATWRQPPKAAALPPARRQAVLASGADNDLAPTLANYQRVANQSLDKLDALLTRQGNRALPALPIYTAATHSLAKESF